jgi:ferredoxin-NADP reductase
MAMLRHQRRTMPELDLRLVYSVRYPDDVIYADEIGDDALLTYTREAPEGWSGHTGHIDAELLREPAAGAQLAFVCGGNGFVETASELLVDLGMEPGTIRTERFGPTS